MIYAGSAPDTAPVVRIFNIENGFPDSTDISVAAPSFAGGVRVASADFTGDGIPDVVAALGAGGLPTIQVFDALTLEPVAGPLGNFLAFESTFTGGVTVATADVDGDGVADIVAGAGSGGGPRVRVFSGVDGAELESFFAFETTFTGGVNVAAADLNGDHKSELIVGAGANGGPRVRVFNPVTDAQLAGPLGSFFAFEPSEYSGVSVASNFWAGDANADGTPDIAVGSQGGGRTVVKVFSGANGAELITFKPFDNNTVPAVSVSMAYIDDDATADVVVASHDKGGRVRVFAGATGIQITGPASEFTAINDGEGVSIAGGNDPHPAWEPPAELPEISVTVADKTASELGLSTGAFVFHRTGSTDDPLTVSYALRNQTGDATEGANQDYQFRSWPDGKVLTPGEVEFPIGVDTVPVLVSPIQDGAIEYSEYVHVSIADDSNGAWTASETDWEGEVELLDDDTPFWTLNEGTISSGPANVWVVSVKTADPNASEDGQSTGAYRVSRWSQELLPTEPLEVTYTLSGTATNGEDYSLSGTVTIPAGSLSETFQLVPVDDWIPENVETVVVTLSPRPTYEFGYFTEAAVNIADNRDARVVIAYADGGEVSQKKGLQVAKWEEAFQMNWDAKSVVVKGRDAQSRDFIDRDPDRFVIWVYDKSEWDNNTARILASISTKNVAGFTEYDDSATPVDLVRYVGTAKGGPGWYWSDSQMLVSNEADDKYIDPAYLVEDVPPTNTMYNADGYQWKASDRTHRVALRGIVKAEYTTAGGVAVTPATAPVPVKHNVKIHAIILRLTVGGGQVIELGPANQLIHKANEQYAQLGLLLIPTFTAIDPPNGVFLANGLTPYVFGDGPSIPLTAEEQSLLGAQPPQQYRTPATDDIELYFVNSFSDGRRGEAFWANNVDAKYADSVIISVADSTTFTVPHEIGHVLLDSGSHYFSSLWPAMLMRNGTDTTDSETASKRFTYEQVRQILGVPGGAPAKRPNLLTGP